MLDKARDQLQRTEARYKEEQNHMQQGIAELHAHLKALGSKHKTKVEELRQDDEVVTEQPQEHNMLGSDSSAERNPWSIVIPIEFKQLPRFKNFCYLLDKFTGKSGEGDFKVWLEDYMEATRHCVWSDE